MSTPPQQQQQLQKQHQVSLRGKSAKEITRDALLQRVSHEREMRSYNRRASAAALYIQCVWRRHNLMKKVARQLREEWQQFVGNHEYHRTASWISSHLLRPFLFFTSQLVIYQKLQSRDVNNIRTCFEILLRSMNYSESEYNFCSLAMGKSAEKATWLYQAKKLVFLCASLLAQYDPNICEEDVFQATSLGMRVIVYLTDPKGWKCLSRDDIHDFSLVKWVLRYMFTRNSCLYISIRKYFLRLSSDIVRVPERNIHSATDKNFLITASAITLALRAFHAKKLGINDLSGLELNAAAEEYYIFVLTIPYLFQRLPSILLPAFWHESSLLPSLNVQLVSKEKLYAEMLKIDQSSELGDVMEGIPCVGWALTNFLTLSTGNSSDSVDSGCFVQGLDFQLYAEAICCISEYFLNWLEKDGLKKHENDECNDDFQGALYSVSDVNSEKFLKSNMSYVNQFKPVYQQSHLRALLAVTRDRGLTQVADISTSTGSRKLKLLDVVFYYSHMLRIVSCLNPLVGSLPILNMISFTPGFLSPLWKELEEYAFVGSTCKSHDSEVQDNHPQYQENKPEKKQKGVLKDTGDKWVHVLHKLTLKQAVDSDDLRIDNTSHNCVEDDAPDSWLIEPSVLNSQEISKKVSSLLHLFCAAYAHLLLVLDDIEFYDKQVPFTLSQQLRISTLLNNFVYNSFIQSGENSKIHVDAAIRCLNLLYQRDCRRKFCPKSLWISPARRGRLPIAAAARAHEAAFTNFHSGETSQKSPLTTIMPHVFPFEERVQMFREFIKMDKASRRAAGELDGTGLEVVIRRNHIVEDGFRQLNCLGSRLKCTFSVSFVSESGLPEVGLDYGGLSKEFLTDLSRSAFSPEYGLFIQTSTSEKLLIPNISARFLDNGSEMIEFLGRIVGKALYEGILLEYSFSLAFIHKLLGRYSFLDELSTLDPELYKNLIFVKHYDGDVMELSLDFTVTEDVGGKRVITELKPGGKDVLVTNDNKLQYVYAISDYKLNRQMLPLANAFFRGLTDLISPSWLRLFNANEFNQLLSGGKHDFDVDDLKRNTRYTGGYSEGSRTVKLFWEVVKEFDANERCMLLKFVTSCSRAPLLGFKYLQPGFTIHKVVGDTTLWAIIGGQDVDRLPSASTCYNTLKLPAYKRSSTLRSKLLYAISSNAGFELS